jgi:hypothetical protein
MAKKAAVRKVKRERVRINPIEAVYGTFLKREAADQRDHSLSHYPSGLCAIDEKGKFIGKCRRATFYELVKEKRSDPIDADGLMKMHIGKLLHVEMSLALDEYLVTVPGAKFRAVDGEAGIGDEIAVKWKDSILALPFSGRLDKRFCIGDWRVGSEWKSIWGMGVNDVKNNGPKEDALLQVLAYMDQQVFPVDEYLLGYVARDSCYIFSFSFMIVRKRLQIEWLNSTSVTICPWSMHDVRRALAGVEEAVASGKVPSRDYQGAANAAGDDLNPKSHWRCRYCGYRSRCYEIKR